MFDKKLKTYHKIIIMINRIIIVRRIHDNYIEFFATNNTC